MKKIITDQKRKFTKKIFFLIILVFFMSNVYARKIVSLPDIFEPSSIVVDSNQIYIVEGTTIHIYSLEDFTLKKKFGRKGEGPQEFKDDIWGIEVKPDYILVNSLNKVSFFTRDGDFLNEKINPTVLGGSMFKPVGNQFVGYSIERENKTFYVVYSIFDFKLKKSKELYRMKWMVQPGRKRKLFETFWYGTLDNKIIIAREDGFTIDVFNSTGEKMFSIDQKYKNLKFTDFHKKKFLDFWKSSYPETYEIRKTRTEFPKYFPAIKTCLIADKKIHVQTYKEKDKKTEFFIFDIDGKLLNKILIPIVRKNPREDYPYWIYNQKLYQLVYDLDKYVWELHITEVE
jgi:hypothetical protein